MVLNVSVVRCTETAQLPKQATIGAAGFDLVADSPLVLQPGQYGAVSTGLKMAIPAGFEGQIRPRSGLAAKYGITVLNSPGTIDSDYRGEIKVLLINHGSGTFHVSPGDRIGQILFLPVPYLVVTEVGTVDGTDRGEGGFGSTGVR